MDLRFLADIAAGSGAAGFGASAGRRLYRDISKNWLLYSVIAICLFGVGYALFDATRGHRNSALRFWGRTVTLNGLIVLLSLAVSALVLAMMTSNGPGSRFPAGLWLLTQAASGALGALIGLSQRKNRLIEFRVADENVAFLREAGLRDVGGSEETWFDADENELKLVDVRDDAVVFRVVGRRGVRALLRWDECGRFVEYTGPSR